MRCAHPLKLFQSPQGGKLHSLEWFAEHSVFTDDQLNDYEIPCGRCVFCRLNYSRVWADRMTEEAMMYPESSNFMITFTYAPEHTDHLLVWQSSFGENYDIPLLSLCYEDLVLFNKRLLKYYKQKFDHQGIRFYACGEYGTKGCRPHFHVCYFNLPIPLNDLKPWKISKKNGKPIQYYTVGFLEDLWGKGIVCVQPFTYEGAAYCSRYVMKKQKEREYDLDQIYNELGIAKEKQVMSRCPGIGVPFYEANRDKIYETGNIFLPGGKKVTPARLYNSKYSVYLDESYQDLVTQHPEDFKKRIKEWQERWDAFQSQKLRREEAAKLAEEQLLASTDLDEGAYFSLLEQQREKIISDKLSIFRHKFDDWS